MANTSGLIEFKGYLQSGDKSARAHIKASDLDDNFRMLTPINPVGKPIFQMTSEGTTFQTFTLTICNNGNPAFLTVLGYLQ